MKRLLFLIVLVTGNYIATAQEGRYGIRAGVNFSSIDSDDIDEDLEDGRIGITVGFVAEYMFSDTFSIQPELQYASQGNDDEVLQVDYLQLPVLFKYNFSEAVHMFLGPQPGLKIWEWEDNGNLEVDFNTFDLAALAGIGIFITEEFFIDIRYSYGFTDVFDSDGIKGSNRNIQVGVGYRL